ncbi:helix-turn-helix domain-containing protein [Loigolactobacillus coryniformis]|jgi:transposase-like protein|uniref:Transposase n=4 Tax=Loigolactobacillus coryniformis TaxID=1610 RepID=A0A5B8TH12_9LACO|nr:helix-turn-helix domain-containing protein [Loigolactobacillus coryniformis]MDN6543420.1 helix-turn-helix domain-containing protein [Lentilactobacillus parabuchneri]MDT3391804.1 helix-turn-helix domain-containing protein [Bacillota bacterium]RRG02569.1 MAG: transposase [Lactobacillus sp.]MDC4187094.1 helix-turn-helix domain-containing protein [Loigolactobacillus coryniformis]QEA53655.1 transposase [Loigolactobacillus coryniformis]
MPRSRHTLHEKLALLAEFKQSGLSIGTFTRQHGIHRETLMRWQSRLERDGLAGLTEAHTNNHYSNELKLKAVQAFLAGEGSLLDLATKFGLRSSTQLDNWVSRYNRDKTLTARPSRKRVPTMSRQTTFEERIKIVEYVTKAKHSYTEAADHFQVSYQQVRTWVIKTKSGGYEALVDNRGHRKANHELTELDKANLQIRELKAQLADKELYEAFIKKFQELQRRG